MVVPVCKEALGKEVIGQLTRLFEPIYAFGELVVYPAVVDILLKFILVDDLMGNDAELDSRILWLIKGSVEVEVSEVSCHEFGPWCGEGAVDDQLDSFEGPRFGSTIASVVDGVVTNGDAGLVGICFCWTHLADNMGVCGIALAILGDIMEHDELHCICSCDLLCVRLGWVLANTLAESPNFICVGCVPCGFVLAELWMH